MSTYNMHLSANPNHPLAWEELRIHAHPEKLARRLFQALSLRLTEWKYRRTLTSLLDYDDHVLEDIGMTRGELIMAIELPLTEDAKLALAQWREERLITG